MWKWIKRQFANPQWLMELALLLASLCIFAMAVDIYFLSRAYYGG